METQAIEDSYPEPGKLEVIWGEGFMSPGGAAEVAHILAGADLTGLSVLDVGSGLGGADIVLVKSHGASKVVGADVQPELVAQASDYARRTGLADRISYTLMERGPLPFPDAAFDVVFSKDAILHVKDKDALYAEMFRVLKPSGRLFVSDWLKGKGENAESLSEAFVVAAGHPFTMVTLDEIADVARRVGFKDIEVESRRDWYLEQVKAELAGLMGELGVGFRKKYGEKAFDDELEFWRQLVPIVEGGGMNPGHIRARKP